MATPLDMNAEPANPDEDTDPCSESFDDPETNVADEDLDALALFANGDAPTVWTELFNA